MILPLTLALAAATPTAEPAEPPITVTGRRIDEAEARREAAAFVRAVGIAAGDTPVARWIDPVCPKVAGLSAEHAAIVAEAVRDRARSIGAKVARRGCRANVVVAFTADGRGFARSALEESTVLAASLEPAKVDELRENAAPVRWWYTHEVRGRDGDRVSSVLPPWTAGEANGGGSVLPVNPDTTVLVQPGSSVVSTQVVRALTSATVVVDVGLATGAPLDAVAAYAAFVALAETRPAEPPRGSILSLFAGDPAPGDWTAADRTFMTALYALPLDRQARQQRSRLVGALANGMTTRPSGR